MFESRSRAALYAGAGILAIGAGMFVVGARWERHKPHAIPDLIVESPHRKAVFPLEIKAGRRYLSDANGTPFLIQGDAAWSAIADLTREEADVYLADRAARGFNSILVNLLEHRYARNAPANAYGSQPFLERDDFTKPNDTYFSHAEWVISRARDRGFLVLLAPAYIGAHGGEDGWWEAMKAAGPERLHAYGRYLGARFGKFDNILWVNGGDFDPPDRNLVTAVARGIREIAPRQLQTAHIAPETPVTGFWKDDDEWLDVVTAYTYKNVCGSTLDSYRATAARPVFLVESFYENENGTDAWRTRSQAYEALLCGASGQVFGNNPVWHFHHPGIYASPGDWWQNLGSDGARSQTYLANIFLDLPWWTLEPDTGLQLVDDESRSELPVQSAKSRDGMLALVYMPSARPINVHLSQMARQPVDARWYDPASGTFANADGTPFEGLQSVRLEPPGVKSTGESDWLLVLRTRSSGAQPAPSPAALPH